MNLSCRKKLNLIDNYIAIYKILHHCKQLLISKSNKELITVVNQICDQTLDLKKKYENAFVKLKMNDTAMDILKHELNCCHNYSISEKHLCSIQELDSSIKIIERDYLKLNI